MTAKYNALEGRQCGTCAKFHNPQGARTGFCVAHPATVFYLGPQPVQRSAIVDPKAPPQFIDALKSFVPVIGDEDGCWEHTPRASLVN